MIGDILQPTHLLFILIVALVVLGPKRLPEVARTLGNGLRDFRSAINGETRDDEEDRYPLAGAHTRDDRTQEHISDTYLAGDPEPVVPEPSNHEPIPHPEPDPPSAVVAHPEVHEPATAPHPEAHEPATAPRPEAHEPATAPDPEAHEPATAPRPEQPEHADKPA